MRRMFLAAVAALGLGLAATSAITPAAAQNYQVYYTVNGIPLSPTDQQAMWDAGLPPGHFWLADNGNWGVMGSAQVLGNIHAGAYAGQGVYSGSGEVYDNGSWSHYSPYSGGVGGDGNGCYYAGDWSNC